MPSLFSGRVESSARGVDTEALVEVADEVDHRVDLVLDLLLGDEDVRVVLGDVLDAQEAVQRPAGSSRWSVVGSAKRIGRSR